MCQDRWRCQVDAYVGLVFVINMETSMKPNSRRGRVDKITSHATR